MHDGDERREDDEDATGPPDRPATGPATERVRIKGAEPAGEATAIIPAVPRSVVPVTPHGEDPLESAVRLTGEPGRGEPPEDAVRPVLPGQTAVPNQPASTQVPPDREPPPTILPHWTEAPTGQVPAVLARDEGSGTTSGLTGPTWREDHSDWSAHEDEFEPSMFGDDEASLGSLDETDQTSLDRRPWEFDLPSSGSSRARPASPADDGEEFAVADEPRPTGSLTERDEAPWSEPSSEDDPLTGVEAGEGPDSTPDRRAAATGDEAVDPERRRPTGRTGVGRDRRTGLRGARVKAKRPTDVDPTIDTPLAAELPGASVTSVPGAGRHRRGMLGLAAADRDAELVGERERDPAVGSSSAIGGVWVETPDVGEVGRAADATDVQSETGRAPGDAGEGDGAPGNPGSSGPAASVVEERPDLGRMPHRSATRSSRRGRDRSTNVADQVTDQDGDRVPGRDQRPTGGPPAPRRGRRTERAPEPGGPVGASTTGLRIGTGLAVAVVALIAFSLGTAPALVLCLVVVTFAAGECFGVLRRAGYHPATLLGLVGTVSLMVAAYTKGPSAVPLVLVLIAAFTLVWYLFGIERGSPVAGSAATLFTVGWVSLLGSYSALLLAPSAFPHREGIAFLLGAVIATVANDVGALVVGGWLGRRPLAPAVSPNKTWEGLFGGALFSVVVSAVVVGAIHPWTPSRAALLGLVVAVVAPIGDLCESMLKRDLGIKDMGRLLPGHGGVLDRVDALLFVLPATYYLVRALHLA